jgi:hypothetical protein
MVALQASDMLSSDCNQLQQSIVALNHDETLQLLSVGIVCEFVVFCFVLFWCQ